MSFYPTVRVSYRNRRPPAPYPVPLAPGRVPPPAVLVWASGELVSTMRGVVREQLRQQQQQQAGASSLQDQPWYDAALQVGPGYEK